MRNLSLEARETDLRIRIDLGLPMVDDADDFLAECARAIEDRDEEINRQQDRYEELEKESATDNETIKELRQEIRQLQFQLDELNKRK